jgi:hypothetical protein
MEETEQENYFFYYLNASIQLAAILLYQNMAIIWPLYIVMGMLGLVIALQTIIAATVFSNMINVPISKKKDISAISVIISIIYMVSCYYIYLAGYVGFAWFAFAHVIIAFFSSIFGAMKK